MIGAAVGQVIASHGGDDDMLELHAPRRFGDTRGFVPFKWKRLGRVYSAEAACAGAAVAGDHESGGAFAPAFPVVRAARAFANGVQLQFVKQGARARKTVLSRTCKQAVTPLPARLRSAKLRG